MARNRSFVRSFGKTLIPVETNHYLFVYHHNLSRVLTQGSALASVALLLGFSSVYVPSSDHYSFLPPLGSHPLTDPLYSNESTSIIHDGAEARRVDKVTKVAESELALSNLTVCIDDMNVNCGKCTKCLRTMISLHVLHARATSFPPLPPLKTIRRVRWKNEPVFLEQNIDLAEQNGHKKLRNALLAAKKRQEQIRLFKEIDRVLLSGLVKYFFRKLRRGTPQVRRIDTTPPRD